MNDDNEVPDALLPVDREKLDALREKVRAMQQGNEQTISGSEAVVEDKSEGTPGVDRYITGKDVDWSEYDIPYNLRHLYPKAVYRETPQGPKWIAVVTEFYSTERAAGGDLKRVDSLGEPINLGAFLTQQVNGSDGWKIAGLLPGSIGRIQVLLQREVPYPLPDPLPLQKATEVEPPSDGEILAADAAGLAWVESEGLTTPATDATIEE